MNLFGRKYEFFVVHYGPKFVTTIVTFKMSVCERKYETFVVHYSPKIVNKFYGFRYENVWLEYMRF